MKERVRENTSEKVNRSIDQKIKQSIELYLPQGKDAINKRVRELEKEWDIERALEVNMPVVALIGLGLGVFVNQWWFIFPALVLLFFLQHAVQGWCPPLPIFRRLGYRTKMEIEKERYALKFLRGDFDELATDRNIQASEVYDAVSKT
jgi:hypothetical protein